jgi:hypothetical protein
MAFFQSLRVVALLFESASLTKTSLSMIRNKNITHLNKLHDGPIF